MKVEILGPGCPKCDDTFERAKQVLDELGLEAELVKVTDVFQIIDRGVNVTPALVIDGAIVFQGKVPTTEKIKEILEDRISAKEKPA
ncbi:MAG: thioredoxin family protein [candidate division Zixibacteria bacterium]|nr:thioredoxin family protein [candidate division Zixibacteria bacterium]